MDIQKRKLVSNKTWDQKFFLLQQIGYSWCLSQILYFIRNEQHYEPLVENNLEEAVLNLQYELSFIQNPWNLVEREQISNLLDRPISLIDNSEKNDLSE